MQFSCIDPLGQRMLRILPEANGILDPRANQQWTSNSAYDLTPVHGRTNHVIRLDSVFTEKTRMALRFVKDRDDDWSWNRFTPGTGFINQNTPGLLIASTISQVLRPTVVNEMGFGYTHNRWGFKAADDFDYTIAVSLRAERRSAAVRAVRGLFGSAAGLAGSASRSTSGRTRRGSHRRRQSRRAGRIPPRPTSRFPA